MSNTVPQLSVSTAGITPALASGQASAAPLSSLPSAIEGFDNWIKNFQKYEAILGEMARVSADAKFKEELTTIEQWFKVLSEPERTASLYTLLQHSTQDQIRFFIAILQQMVRPEEPSAPPPAVEAPVKPKLSKLTMRPPSLDLPNLGSPATPTPLTAKTQDSAFLTPAVGSEAAKGTVGDNSWASMVNTPLVPMFKNDTSAGAAAEGSKAGLPGLGMLNPYTLNMLANAGLSSEAQLLAVQLIMSGLVQPTGLTTQQAQPQAQPKSSKKPSQANNWRTPTSARYPASALRSSGLRSSGLKSAALKSSGLDSASLDSPKVEDFNPEMLNDIPAWLRSLRLHKYTACFDGLSWQEMVVLDDATLESKGVAALGARRRLLRTFEHVRKEMGMEEPTSATSATPTTGIAPTSVLPEHEQPAPHSAHPRSKLSINSPVFTPTWENKAPHSAAPSISVDAPVASPSDN
ncbi:hypothetical protein BDQ12DRAFT_620619 [Crucibulum laeve]|uniref:RNA-binding protein VTS1 n=1 Tax=Crucibulum laeve TaxID=68775 RepID=A0A5C3MSZ8_9AGAR|nr:hypothetical protein BDQ12DRAFT_620619 [Crucibulum laeve]